MLNNTLNLKHEHFTLVWLNLLKKWKLSNTSRKDRTHVILGVQLLKRLKYYGRIFAISFIYTFFTTPKNGKPHKHTVEMTLTQFYFLWFQKCWCRINSTCLLLTTGWILQPGMHKNSFFRLFLGLTLHIHFVFVNKRTYFFCEGTNVILLIGQM